jgi:hypothetical protein
MRALPRADAATYPTLLVGTRSNRRGGLLGRARGFGPSLMPRKSSFSAPGRPAPRTLIQTYCKDGAVLAPKTREKQPRSSEFSIVEIRISVALSSGRVPNFRTTFCIQIGLEGLNVSSKVQPNFPPSQNQTCLFVKGAPESVLERCTHVKTAGGKVTALTGTMRDRILEEVRIRHVNM